MIEMLSDMPEGVIGIRVSRGISGRESKAVRPGLTPKFYAGEHVPGESAPHLAEYAGRR